MALLCHAVELISRLPSRLASQGLKSRSAGLAAHLEHCDDSGGEYDQTMIPVDVDRTTWLWRCDLIQGAFSALMRCIAMPGSEMPGIDYRYSLLVYYTSEGISQARMVRRPVKAAPNGAWPK